MAKQDLLKENILDDKDQIIDMLNGLMKPKDEERKKYGEVFTPLCTIDDMLNKLPDRVWTDPNLKWFDPASGVGNFTISVYYRLLDSLKDIIPDYEERKTHIITKQLYSSEINKKNIFWGRKFFEGRGNIYEGDSLTLDTEKVWGIKKFDIILGNPPYNKETTKAGSSPLYHEFVQCYIDKCNILLFIIPSRWFTGGKGLDKFRSFMFKREDIKLIKHYNDASLIFPETDIKGGVNIFLKDSEYKGMCQFNNDLIKLGKYDVLIDEIKFYPLINKLNKFTSLDTLYVGRNFGVETVDERLHDKNKDKKMLKCYVSKKNNFTKYISKEHVKREYDYWKVITARAAHEHRSGFGNIVIGSPTEIHSGSYISFRVNSKKEAKSLVSYMRCKLPNLMLALRKSAQDISKGTIKWIPLPSLNNIWTDDMVHKYFKLTKEDIKIIVETKIAGYLDVSDEIIEEHSEDVQEKRVMNDKFEKEKIDENVLEDEDMNDLVDIINQIPPKRRSIKKKQKEPIN
jgi:site-specific DNA-methyltransferase (adenine-specific)